MTLTEFFDLIPADIDGNKTLIGDDLLKFKKELSEIEDFKGKKINIIDNILDYSLPYEFSDDVFYLINYHKPRLLTINGSKKLKNLNGLGWKSKIYLWALGIKDDEIAISCNEYSIKMDKEIIKIGKKNKIKYRY